MKINDKINSFTFIRETNPKIRINGCKRRMGLFRCNCGNEKIYAFFAVKSGCVKQCITCGVKISAEKRKKHGLTRHPLYSKWRDMINRCYNKNVDRYPNYGGRGIKICDEWRYNFKDFYDWCIANNWEKKLTIDRKDVNGNYNPENCRLITMIEQGFNRTNTFYVEYNGKKIGLSELLYRNNMSKRYSVIWHGLKAGLPIERYIKRFGIKIT